MRKIPVTFTDCRNPKCQSLPTMTIKPLRNLVCLTPAKHSLDKAVQRTPKTTKYSHWPYMLLTHVTWLNTMSQTNLKLTLLAVAIVLEKHLKRPSIFGRIGRSESWRSSNLHEKYCTRDHLSPAGRYQGTGAAVGDGQGKKRCVLIGHKATHGIHCELH